jgi:hypothetical protein
MTFNFTEYETAAFLEFIRQNRPKFYNNALCLGKGIDTFFPGNGQSNKARQAIKMCEECPVRFECLSYAQENKIEDGIWGGSTPKQRQQWLSKNTSVEEAWESLQVE